MNYSEAIQFLYGLQMFGANFGLETTRRLAALAGEPQQKLRFIHVAGTNGKGSTCAMLESIYRAAGLRVGLYTSPHLVSFRERMQVNRQFASEAEVARLAGEVQSLLKQFPADAHPTMFEVVTVMALKFFAEQKCDLVIWETGLGGRLDATNIVTPLASVITNIALDHMQWLGDTLEKIAAEKAGIIKPGVPVVTAAREAEGLAVIERVAREKGASVTQVGADSSFGVKCPTSLLGGHQRLNAALTVATVEVLQGQISVTEEQIRAGLAQVNWPGRLQLIERDGHKILLDGAHNVAGAEVLRAALEGGASVFNSNQEIKLAESEFGAPVVIIGVLGDKEWRAMCGILAPVARKIFTVPVASARTADAGELAAFFKTANPEAEVGAFKNVSEALNASKDAPLVVVAGSLYLIGEALEVLGVSPSDGGERGLNEWSTKR
ncbi:MAG TPA: folylpolyglutamate synthase/dihydrofolate synthase family protein [Verrucomicrobiae bacterium]|nr:folylpolyglutamate synthase/dihydrofolate synthase family protein [Verrucomicrobiae bacterium]